MWQVVGQDRILALLDRSLEDNSVAHAYLLVGPRHVGKRTLAINLAQALNCTDSKPPCGQCHSCCRIVEGKHADVITTKLTSRTEIGIDDIRRLQHMANLPPYEGERRVFIIDDAEYMSTEAANSLLKILEEPPPKVIWLLLASDERHLLPTVLSRCQKLALKPMPINEARKMLISRYGVEPAKAELLAHLSQGCLGWAISVLKNGNLFQERCQRIEKLSSLVVASLEERFAYAQELANQFSHDRRIVVEIVGIWLSWWRDLILTKAGCQEAIININYEKSLEEQAELVSLREIKNFIDRLCLLPQEIAKNVNPRLAIESLMLNMPWLK